MRSTIVPIFDDSDLKALPNCLRYLAGQGVEILLVLHGPNVGVVPPNVTDEIDKKIADLEVRKKELVLVDDFAGAQKAKESAEALKVERDMLVRDSWKKVEPAERQKMYQKAFANIGTEPICLREAYSHDQLFAMMQAFLPQFPSDLIHGQYSIIWPRSVPSLATQPVKTHSEPGLSLPHDGPRVKDLPLKGGTLSRGAGEVTQRGKREAQLRAEHHLKVFRIAAESGIPTKGMKTPDVIKAILDKEFPAELAAA